MKTFEISSAVDLLSRLNKFPNHYMFRGHADADWRLESSLERVLGKRWSSEFAAKSEERSLDQFQSKFHLYDRENVQPKSKLSWLSIMQHYGVPTRLLDFTESPYVALYFALETYSPESKRDFAVIAVDYTAVMEKSLEYIRSREPNFAETRASVYRKQDVVFDEVVDGRGFDIAWIGEPREFNKRLDRQAGTFLLSGNPGHKIQDVLDSAMYEGAVEKYVIPNVLYEPTYALLRKMNLTSKSIYGDLQGLARSIRMELQVYSSE